MFGLASAGPDLAGRRARRAALRRAREDQPPAALLLSLHTTQHSVTHTSHHASSALNDYERIVLGYVRHGLPHLLLRVRLLCFRLRAEPVEPRADPSPSPYPARPLRRTRMESTCQDFFWSYLPGGKWAVAVRRATVESGAALLDEKHPVSTLSGGSAYVSGFLARLSDLGFV